MLDKAIHQTFLAMDEDGTEAAAATIMAATATSKKSLWVLIPLSLYALYSGGSGVIKVLRAIHSVAWGEPLKKARRAVVFTRP